MVRTIEPSRKNPGREARTRTPQREAIAILAHDLRTPLSAVLSGLDVARDPGLKAESRHEILNHVRTAAEAALRLTSDLMDIAVLESGRLQLEPEWVDLGAVIGTVCGMAYRQDGPLTPKVRYDVASDARKVWGDQKRVMQIIQNLVENAVKFTPPDGRVDVVAHRRGGEIRIEVRDSGIGIPPDDLPLLFDRFWQARRWQRGGAGLGLAIVKSLAEIHHGEVEVWSRSGQGSVFTVTLPFDSRDRTRGNLSDPALGADPSPSFRGFAPALEGSEEG